MGLRSATKCGRALILGSLGFIWLLGMRTCEWTRIGLQSPIPFPFKPCIKAKWGTKLCLVGCHASKPNGAPNSVWLDLTFLPAHGILVLLVPQLLICSRLCGDLGLLACVSFGSPHHPVVSIGCCLLSTTIPTSIFSVAITPM